MPPDNEDGSEAGRPGLSLQRRERPPAYVTDSGFYRRVAYMLGGIAVLSIGLGFWAVLGSDDGEVPDFLIAVASTSIGALAGVFAGGTRN